MKTIVLLSAFAACASMVFAQGTLPAYPLESEIRLEVWNGSSWGNTVNASPGQQVEYRVVMNYTGPRTDLLGLGDSRYQVSFNNADNSGASQDTLVAFPDGGTSIAPSLFFPTPSRNLLTAQVGIQGGPLPAYGRVVYGGIGQTANNQNRLTNFRHGDGAPQNGAPVGSWLRVAGELVRQWAADSLPTSADVTADAINSIARGVSSSQPAPVLASSGFTNQFFAGGVTNLVVFRHAIVLSDRSDSRTMELSVLAGSLLRVGSVSGTGVPSSDDRRYIQWHENQTGNFGTYRTSVTIVPATIVIPTPGVFAVVGIGGIFAVRRRR